VNNVSSENYDESESGTGKNSWIQVTTGKKKAPEDKIILRNKQIAISNRCASRRYLQESSAGHHVNHLVTSKISEGKKENYC